MSMMVQGGPPPGLAALIAAAQQAGPGDQDDKGPYPDDGGLSCLQDIITDFPRLLHELTDPADVQAATMALSILTKVQTRLMQANGGPSGASSPNQ